MLKQPLPVLLAGGVVPLVLVLNVSTVDLPCRSGTPGGQDPPALFVWFTQLQSQAQCGGFVKMCATDKYAIQFLKLCIMENCKHTQKLTDHKSPCTPPPPPSIILNILLSCSHHSLLIICFLRNYICIFAGSKAVDEKAHSSSPAFSLKLSFPPYLTQSTLVQAGPAGPVTSFLLPT